MQLSINTDFAKDKGDPTPYLKAISEAGFTHVHWCHHWASDFVYMDSEINQIGEWLDDYGLKLLDLHGSVGPEKNWFSDKEYERLAGVELVKNRLEMTARLGGDAVVMHIPSGPISDGLKKSLDALAPHANKLGVRIAVENGCFEAMNSALSEFGPDYLGLCYDCGHGNMDANGLGKMDVIKDRLIAIHLHDNDGINDEHKIPFTSTVDWNRLIDIIARSSYSKCINLEVSMRNMGIEDVDQFVQLAYQKGAILTQMLESARE